MIVVTEDSTADQIAEAIGYLRARQRRARNAEVIAEVGESIDELLDLWRTAADNAGAPLPTNAD